MFNNKLFRQLEDPEATTALLKEINKEQSSYEDLSRSVTRAFAGSQQQLPKKADSDGLVTVNSILYNNGLREREEFWKNFRPELLALLKSKLDRSSKIRPSDIMILVRSNDDASLLAAVLAEENIPVVTENSLLLNGECLIEEAVALLEFMCNPYNDRALHTVLCGEAFLGHPDAAGLDREKIDRLAFSKNGLPLFKVFKDSFPDQWKKLLQPFYAKSTIMTPYDVIKEWFRSMGLEQRYPERRLFLESFLEYIYNAEAGKYNSIPAFLEHWQEEGIESKAAMPEGVEAVRIMTIHKAKGLQAPIVIVPIADKALRVKANKSNKRRRLKLGNLNLNVRLLKEFHEIYEGERVRESQEILNLLYVAFTRAEKELHIYTSMPAKINPKNPKISILESMLHAAGMNFPMSIGVPWAGRKKDEKVKADEIGESCGQEVAWEEAAFPWISKLKVAKNTLFQGGDYAERRGKFIHFCLENLHLSGNPAKDARDAVNFALSHSGIELKDGDSEGIYEGLLWFLSQKESRDWLENGYPEQSMLDGAGNELRMDLLVPREWGVLVLDYKSGQMADKNMEQMTGYLRCLQESGEFEGEICGLLVYLDQRKFVPVSLLGPKEDVNKCPALPFK